MTSNQWQRATKERPCPVCGKPDWCSISPDGAWANCRRTGNGTGQHKVDASGASYWVHKLREPSKGGATDDAFLPDPNAVERADPDVLGRAHDALLNELSLSHAHRQDLHRRGLSEAEIKRNGYRTLPSDGREKLAQKLVERFGAEVCSKVPGLYVKENGRFSVAGASGLLVPVRDARGRITALKVRSDVTGDGPKYSSLSSKKYGGSGPGAQVHVPLRDGRDPTVVRLTEGELKADVATSLSGLLSISVPGVSSWRLALPVLKGLGPDHVRLAFDADARTNPTVARALSGVFGALEELGYRLAIETWPRERGKGVDDVLAAGHKPAVLGGADARRALNDIMTEATGGSRVLEGVLTAEKLLAMAFPEPKWIVPEIVPEGATILAGAPKLGKSWMALGMALAVAAGGTALGKERVERGSVLYLGLEDNLRRLQSRLRKLLDGDPAPAGLELIDGWPRLDEGGLEALEAWLAAHGDARLVVVDTLAKVRKRGTGKNLYDEDYAAVEPLLDLAARHHVAVLIIHHLRKATASDPLEEVSGSMGLTGGVDGVMVLKRERGRADAFLYVTGRDIEEEQELALTWDSSSATWRVVGEAEEYKLSQERQEVIDCLRSIGAPAGPKEVSEALGKKHNSIKQLMWRMGEDGDLRNVGGKYLLLTDNLDNRNNRDDASPITEDPTSHGVSHDAQLHEEDVSLPPVSAVIEVTDARGVIDNGEVPPSPITTRGELEALAEELRAADVVAVDLETTGLSPRTERVRLISLSTATGSRLVDCFEADPRALFPVLAEKRLVFHNAAFDLGFLFEMGFEFGAGGGVVDTMLLSKLLEEGATT